MLYKVGGGGLHLVISTTNARIFCKIGRTDSLQTYCFAFEKDFVRGIFKGCLLKCTRFGLEQLPSHRACKKQPLGKEWPVVGAHLGSCFSFPGFPKQVRERILLSSFQLSWPKGGALGEGGTEDWSVAPHRRVSGEVANREGVQGRVGFLQRAGAAHMSLTPYVPVHLSESSFI